MKIRLANPSRACYRDEEWSDLVRQAGDPEGREAMERHVADGCRRCGSKLRLWTAVSRVAVRETSYEPPDGATRQARAQFSVHRPEPRSSRARRTISMLFDSVREPAPVGVRTGGSTARQLLYGDGRRMLRLRIESQPDSDSFSLVGQIIEAGSPDRELPTLPVSVQSGRKTVTQTLTNRLGEFELELPPSKSLRLVVGVASADLFEVLLPVDPPRRERRAKQE